MFKIAKNNLAEPLFPGSAQFGEAEAAIISQFAVSESWTGDLSNGVICLGDRAMALHGLPSSECGLLTMMRCYQPNDRAHILQLFEQAATSSSNFCYSTTIDLANGSRQPVFCIGESNGFSDDHAGTMLGVFLFPHFKLPMGRA